LKADQDSHDQEMAAKAAENSEEQARAAADNAAKEAAQADEKSRYQKQLEA